MENIERIICGNVNCFLVSNDNGSILIDTARPAHRNKIIEACKHKSIKLIVLTHGHVDHVQNAAFLSKELNAPVAIHKADYELLKDNMLQPLSAHSFPGKIVLALSIKSFKEDVIEPFTIAEHLKECDTLSNFGFDDIEIVELPGHTKGSIGLLVGKSDFIVGDALMNMFYPCKSMLYENRNEMESSAHKIFNSGAKTIHFGHGKSIANRPFK